MGPTTPPIPYGNQVFGGHLVCSHLLTQSYHIFVVTPVGEEVLSMHQGSGLLYINMV